MDCLDPSVIKKRKLTQSDYKVKCRGQSEIGVSGRSWLKVDDNVNEMWTV